MIPYVDATVLTYSLVRQQIHGIPAGTIATIKLQAADKRRISFSGAYRPRGGFLLAGVRVDAKVDPLDIMRDRISRVIAERLADDLLNSLPVRWGPLSMTATAVTPNRGKHKGQAVPFLEIDREGEGAGLFTLFRVGDKRGFITIHMSDPNFWPCFMLYRRMMVASRATSSEFDPD